MPEYTIKIFVDSNDKHLQKKVCSSQEVKGVSFHDTRKETQHTILLIRLDGDQQNITNTLVDEYSESKQKNGKIAICLIHGEKYNQEKNHTFQKTLNDLGGNSPIHRLIITKDLYQDFDVNPISSFEHLISKTIEQNEIFISSKGSNYFYPITLQELINGTLKSLFYSSTNGQSYHLFGEKTKDLDIAYLLKKAVEANSQTFEINSISKNTPENSIPQDSIISTQIELNWRPDQDFSENIKTAWKNNQEEIEDNHQENKARKLRLPKILQSLIKHHKEKDYTTVNQTVKQLAIKNIRQGILTVLLIFILLLVSTSALSVLYLYQGYKSLAISSQDFQAGDYQNSVIENEKAKKFLSFSDSIKSLPEYVLNMVSPYTLGQWESAHLFLRLSSESVDSLNQIALITEKTYRQITSDERKNEDIENVSLVLESNLASIHEKLSQIDIMVSKHMIPIYLDKYLTSNSYFQNLSILTSQVDHAIKLAQLLPNILPSPGRTHILILFQNNHQLRPTGGVIEHLATIDTENGKFKAFQLLSSSQVSSTQSATTATPDILKKTFGTDQWRFKDMNLSPDIQEAGQQISWYYEQSTSKKPDYVIFLQNSFFEKLLKEENYSLKEEIYDQEKFKDSMEKEPEIYYLASQHFLEKIQSGTANLSKYGRVIIDELENNNMHLFSQDINIEQQIIATTYSGVITSPKCHSLVGSDCLSIYSYLNEANLSVAPLNQIIERKEDYQLLLADATVKHTYKLAYHFSQNISSLNRDYLAFYQLATPPNSFIEKISIDGQEQEINKIVTKESRGDYDIFSFLATLGLNEDHLVEISFIQSTNTNFSNTAIPITITKFQQPGNINNSTVLNLSLPPTHKIKSTTHQFDTKDDQNAIKLPSKTTSIGLNLGLK